jgi:hypothetical protein
VVVRNTQVRSANSCIVEYEAHGSFLGSSLMSAGMRTPEVPRMPILAGDIEDRLGTARGWSPSRPMVTRGGARPQGSRQVATRSRGLSALTLAPSRAVWRLLIEAELATRVRGTSSNVDRLRVRLDVAISG